MAYCKLVPTSNIYQFADLLQEKVEMTGMHKTGEKGEVNQVYEKE